MPYYSRIWNQWPNVPSSCEHCYNICQSTSISFTSQPSIPLGVHPTLCVRRIGNHQHCSSSASSRTLFDSGTILIKRRRLFRAGNEAMRTIRWRNLLNFYAPPARMQLKFIPGRWRGSFFLGCSWLSWLASDPASGTLAHTHTNTACLCAVWLCVCIQMAMLPS